MFSTFFLQTTLLSGLIMSQKCGIHKQSYFFTFSHDFPPPGNPEHSATVHILVYRPACADPGLRHQGVCQGVRHRGRLEGLAILLRLHADDDPLSAAHPAPRPPRTPAGWYKWRPST